METTTTELVMEYATFFCYSSLYQIEQKFQICWTHRLMETSRWFIQSQRVKPKDVRSWTVPEILILSTASSIFKVKFCCRDLLRFFVLFCFVLFLFSWSPVFFWVCYCARASLVNMTGLYTKDKPILVGLHYPSSPPTKQQWPSHYKAATLTLNNWFIDRSWTIFLLTDRAYNTWRQQKEKHKL